MSEQDLDHFVIDCNNKEEQYKLMAYQYQMSQEYYVPTRSKWLINQQLMRIRNQCF
jgi:hypothetical protein